MPTVTSANVALYTKRIVTEKDAFLARLPALVETNLKSGNIAYEGTN